MTTMKSLKEINIYACKINDDIAAVLAEVLNNNKELNKLDLEYSYLQASQVTTIMSSLQTRVLKNLDLTSNYISDEATYSIANVILNNHASVEYFGIGSNNLHTYGMISVLNSLKSVGSLTHLSLACNNMTENISKNITDVIYSNA